MTTLATQGLHMLSPAVIADVTFLVLFAGYSAQLYFIQVKRKALIAKPEPARSPPTPLTSVQIWGYLVPSLLGPVMIGFLPELIAAAVTSDPALRDANPVHYIGVRFLATYLVTVITLEMTIRSQMKFTGRLNPWSELLDANVLLDIASIIVLIVFKVFPAVASDGLVITFFVVCAIPTLLTGAVVVVQSYTHLTRQGR